MAYTSVEYKGVDSAEYLNMNPHIVMVLNILKSHSINFAVAFFYACYVTSDTVIWAIRLASSRPNMALDLLSGPTGKAEFVPSDTWNGYKWKQFSYPACRAAESIAPKVNSPTPKQLK